MPAHVKKWLATAVMLFAALMLSACDFSSQPSESLASAADDTTTEHLRKHADPTYVCPMHPQIVRNEPGSCPICGMNLVLQETGPAGAGNPTVQVSAATRQNMGLRTTSVERLTLWKFIDTVGYVAYDEDSLLHVHPRANGWVEKIYVRAEGDTVKQGQTLLEYYSPEVVVAQEEYLIALRMGATADLGVKQQSLLESARIRMRLLEIPEEVITEITRTRKVRRTMPVVARHGGIVTRLGVREGMYVTPQLEMYTIANLSNVWVMVDVFEDQLSWVEVGRPAEVRVAALPGKVWQGSVDYLYPQLDPKTRTLKVRLRIPNPEGVLTPNMYANAMIFGGPKNSVLAIPREALIPSGEATRVVKLVEEDRFQPVNVVVGMQSMDKVEILEGLNEGDRVVVSGQFLIDSESNLQASFRRMGAEPSGSGHDH